MGSLFVVRFVALICHMPRDILRGGRDICSGPEHCVEEVISSVIMCSAQFMVPIVSLQVILHQVD
jgi:hypothetical protein